VIDARAEVLADDVPSDAEPAAPAEPPEGVAPDVAAVASARKPFPLLPLAVAVTFLLSAGAAYFAWQQSASAPAAGTDLAQVQTRLDRLETAPRPAFVTPDQLAALEKRLATLEQRPAPQAPAAGNAGPQPALTALETRLATVEKLARDAATAATSAANRPAPAPPAQPPRVDLSPLENRLASLEAQFAAPKTDVRATEDPSVSPNRPGDRTALAVVAQALADAVDRGRPFQLELTAAEALGADDGQIRLLKPLAERGAPTREALSRAFAQVAPKILAAAEPSTEGQGLMDRLTSATKLVRVRPVGEAAGEDPPALVSRIELALTRGDMAGAQRDWGRLPEPARAAGSGFADLLQQRVAAEAAARSLRDSSISALARAKD
jgi:hypothetical protein